MFVIPQLIVLFYITGLVSLIQVPNQQTATSVRRPVLPQQVLPSVYKRGYYKVTTYPDRTPRYVHSFNIDNRGHIESQFWNPQAASRLPVRAFQPRQPGLVSTVRQPINSYKRSSEESTLLSRQNASLPFINKFIHTIREHKLFDRNAKPIDQFKKTILGNYSDFDLVKSINNSNIDFAQSENDCQPQMTQVKFGQIMEPEVIYNPPSVMIKRCSQGCLSWQFDCVPTKTESHVFSVAVYTVKERKISRDVRNYTIVSHTECACKCQSFASCLADPIEYSSARTGTINF